MQIALVHNERAGARTYSSDDLLRILREAGHSANAYASDIAGVQHAIEGRPDVIAVSGGDGTVARVAIALRTSRTPMFILPTGTANNIATSVGVTGDDIADLARRLSGAASRRLDVCRIAGDGCEAHFVEAAGIGVIGTMLEQETRRVSAWSRRVQGWMERGADHWESTARYVAHLMRHERARWINIRADGHDLSGEYVTVEVMNIHSIGPRVVLASEADPGDGWLDLVLVSRADQHALADRIESRDPTALTTPRRVRHVDIDWPNEAAHVDDERWPDADTPCPGRVTIRVPDAVEVLVSR